MYICIYIYIYIYICIYYVYIYIHGSAGILLSHDLQVLDIRYWCVKQTVWLLA